MTPITRRRLLATAGSAFLLPISPSVAGSNLPLGKESAPRRIFTGLESAALLGRRVMSGGDEAWRSREALEIALESRLTAFSIGAQARDLSDSELRRCVREAIAADFRAGRTVEVEGWVFSETECRLFALAALEERTPPAAGF